MTVAKYLTPKMSEIQGKGVVPDLKLDPGDARKAIKVTQPSFPPPTRTSPDRLFVWAPVLCADRVVGDRMENSTSRRLRASWRRVSRPLLARCEHNIIRFVHSFYVTCCVPAGGRLLRPLPLPLFWGRVMAFPGRLSCWLVLFWRLCCE